MNLNKLYRYSLPVLVLAIASLFSGCSKSEMEDAADKTEDAVENAADEVGDAAEKVADDVKDATN